MGCLPRPRRPRRLPVAERLPLVGEDAFLGTRAVRHRLGERPVGLLVDPLLRRLADRVYVDTVRAQLLLVALERIARRPLLEQLTRDVLVVVVCAMPVH